MKCPHASPAEESLVRCSLAQINVHPKTVCGACQARWRGGPPSSVSQIPIASVRYAYDTTSQRRELIAVRQAKIDHAERLRKNPWLKVWFFLATMFEWGMAGFPRSSQDLAKDRLENCRRCPKGWWRNNRCLACGCGPIKFQVQTAKCPIGEW